MTDQPLERYFDDFRRLLEEADTKQASPGRRRRQRGHDRRRALATTAIALAVALLVVVASLPGTRRLDVVGEARAALGPPGQLVHFVVRQSTLAPRDVEEYTPVPPVVLEQWSTTSGPPRWRLAFSYPDPEENPDAPRVMDARGPLVGPVQLAYADGVQSTYYQQRNALQRVGGFAADGAASAVPGETPLGSDPVAAIRGMLARGRLKDIGTEVVAGRTVRRLVGGQGSRLGNQTITTRIQYDVAPDTFVPVQVRVERTVPGSPQHRKTAGSVTIVLRFLAFERLNLTPANRQLLEIQPVGRPTVTETPASRSKKP